MNAPLAAAADAGTMTLTHGGAERPAFLGMKARFLRGVTLLVIAALFNTSLVPLANALQMERALAATTEATTSDEQRYADALQTLLDRASISTATTRSILPASYGNADTLESYADSISAQSQELIATWQAAGVDPALIARQQALEKTFRAEHQQLITLLQAAQATGAGERERSALLAFLQRELPASLPSTVNLDNLPWKVVEPTKDEPATTDAALEKKLALEADTLTLKAATASTAADLAATLDAPQTTAIQKLATDLGKNPHTIYQWVHDNIYWQPTHGSVQGAQNTLDKKAGNATDTASLLIALLRASGIPARYVYGTVDIPADQVMNWVGGAKTIDAAQQILGQGHIPNVALVSGGKITAVRIEHTWVEALIQYQPGRGAKHIAGVSTPDMWVPLDASFKQYTFTSGMDLTTAVPLDAEALLEAAQQGATVNEAEGWVKNLNTTALQNQLTAYQDQLKTYIDSQNGGQSTVGDVLGIHRAKIDPLPYLAGTLPYTIKARSQQFSTVPTSLRAQFRYRIYSNATNAAWGDSPLLSFTAPTASLAGKKLTLAWVAATAADQAAIEALIPKNLTDPNQLPRTIPASVRLKPQIILEGEIQATGSAMNTGSEPVGVGGFTQFGQQSWDETQDQLIVGQQSALGLSIQGISQAQLDTLKTRMEDTKATLEQAQAAPEAQRPEILKDLTGDQLTGDLLTATIWGYFAAMQSQGAIASSQAEMFDAPALSYGLFHAQVKPNKLYGIVTTGVTVQGLNIDIGHLRHIRWVQDDNPQSAINDVPALTENGKSAAQNRWIAYNRMRGQYASAMEHAVPEQFWVDKSTCRYTDENGQVQNPTLAACQQAISAVKAIAIAQAEGQKIYTINQENRATALSKLPVGGDVGAEIISAVNAGKEVTVHEKAITAFGWTGYGYTIVDPDTGAGAYIIEGKGNGGWLAILGALIKVIMILPAIIFATAILLMLLPEFAVGAILLMVSGTTLWINAEIYLSDYPCAQDFFKGLATTILGALGGASIIMTKLAFWSSLMIGFGISESTGAAKTCITIWSS